MASAHKDYSGTPLIRKLGVVTAKGPVSEVALIAAPESFRALLGEIPETVRLTKRVGRATGLAICFTRSAKDVEAVATLLAGRLPAGASAWIVWPKARLKPGYNENLVRDTGLAVGLVDYKVCSVDEDWSGLKFAHRKA